MNLNIYAACLTLTVSLHAERPLFTFGVISDVQYADHDTAGARAYRDSVAKLEQCAAALKKEKTEFVAHTGDLVDRDEASLDRILPIWNTIPGPRYLVLGNHDFVTARDALIKRLGMPGPWYDFTAKSWRFLVLDGMNVSVAGGWHSSDGHQQQGEAILESLKQAGASNAQTWNGAVGREQREWLQRTLSDAARRRQRTIVFCHFPTIAESCRPEHLLWDHAEVAGVLESSPSVVAYINGHDHRGGYAEHNGVHYVTLPGMVEHDATTACSVVDVYADKLVQRTAGGQVGRTLWLRSTRSVRQ